MSIRPEWVLALAGYAQQLLEPPREPTTAEPPLPEEATTVAEPARKVRDAKGRRG